MAGLARIAASDNEPVSAERLLPRSALAATVLVRFRINAAARHVGNNKTGLIMEVEELLLTVAALVAIAAGGWVSGRMWWRLRRGPVRASHIGRGSAL